MGKRYYCDYCNKTMVSTPALVKTHNNGLAHQKLVQEHYKQFKDAETILREERIKKPCLRFSKGECVFGSVCRFSHYSKEELDSLRMYVANKNKISVIITPQISLQDLYQKLQEEKSKSVDENFEKHTTTLHDKNGVTHVLPWVYNKALDSHGDDLPPSIKRMKVEDFQNAHIVEFG